MKQFTKPLDAYHLKRFAGQAKKDSTGEALTTEEIKKLQKQGDENTRKSDEELERSIKWKHPKTGI